MSNLTYQTVDIKNQQEFNTITSLISNHLSEPYSIYVYWYFLNTWPQYCYTVKLDNTIIGVIISKIDCHKNVRIRGYIGMLVVDDKFRNQGIAKKLVKLTVDNMIKQNNVDEISLETEVINKGALRLYEGLGFMKVKRLYKYYLNTHDAFRLILPISDKSFKRIAFLPKIDGPILTSNAGDSATNVKHKIDMVESQYV